LATSNVLFVLMGAIALAFVIVAARTNLLGFDFRGTLWDPGKDILAGNSPYPPPHPAAIRTGNPAVYPPAVMLVVAPLTLLPWAAGIAVWLVVSTLAVALGLWFFGIRDWRIYAIVASSNPFLVGLIHGNLTLLLFLGLAILWRWRDSPRVAGALVAALVVGKLFLWPLFAWLLVTRRFRAAGYAVALTVVATIGAWAIIGFDGFRTYPKLLSALDRVYAPHSLSLASLEMSLGLPQRSAEVVALAIGLALIGTGAMLVRRSDSDERMYIAAVIAALVATPILWLYYYLLLTVPLALYRPRLARPWWIAAGFWTVAAVGSATQATPPCCRPAGMPRSAWVTLATKPSLTVLVCGAMLLALTALVTLSKRPERLDEVSSGERAPEQRALYLGRFRGRRAP
jgi:hypothetical protein